GAFRLASRSRSKSGSTLVSTLRLGKLRLGNRLVKPWGFASAPQHCSTERSMVGPPRCMPQRERRPTVSAPDLCARSSPERFLPLVRRGLGACCYWQRESPVE